MPLKCQFLRILPPQFSSDPQKAVPCAERCVLSKKEKRQWQTGHSPRPPTSLYRSQSLHAGWPPVCSSIYCFIKIGSVVLPLWMVENRPFPITLAIGLYNSLYCTAVIHKSQYASKRILSQPSIYIEGCGICGSSFALFFVRRQHSA